MEASAARDPRAAGLACDRAGWVASATPRCAALFAADAALLAGCALETLFPDEPGVRARLARTAPGESLRLRGRRLTGEPVVVEAEAAVAPDGSLACRFYDVLGATASSRAASTAGAP